MTKFSTYFIVCFATSSLYSITSGQGPLTISNTNSSVKPYPDCDVSMLWTGGSVTKNTPPIKVKQGPIYFYPFTSNDKRLFLHIVTSTTLFKAYVEGTIMELKRCDLDGGNCKVEDAGGRKTIEFISSHHWNKISAFIKGYQMIVTIGVQHVMTMSSLPKDELKEAKWSIHTMDETDYIPVKSKTSTTYQPNAELLYLAQTNCNEDEDYEYVPETSPHHGDSHTHEKKNYVGMVVGLVILSLLLLVAVVIIWVIMSKRRAEVAITESAVLQETTSSKN